MSLQAKILNLLSGIDDPGIRIEISRTIYYLYNVYKNNIASEESIKNDLMEICLLIVQEKEPTLSPEDQKKKAEKLANDILNAFKLETLTRRKILRYGV
ncbi:MAG: hypothetical protein DRJ03_28090 [Chloroflexi bacterium]|nr:MAG: hypothetical protein DRJ03_28090 [Chloroflexota bacterium]